VIIDIASSGENESEAKTFCMTVLTVEISLDLNGSKL